MLFIPIFWYVLDQMINWLMLVALAAWHSLFPVSRRLWRRSGPWGRAATAWATWRRLWWVKIKRWTSASLSTFLPFSKSLSVSPRCDRTLWGRRCRSIQTQRSWEAAWPGTRCSRRCSAQKHSRRLDLKVHSSVRLFSGCRVKTSAGLGLSDDQPNCHKTATAISIYL